MSENKCCGNCKFFTNEDAEGWGVCAAFFNEFEAHCNHTPCITYKPIERNFNGWTEITPDNVEELYNIPEDLLIVAFKLGDIIYYKRNKDMRPTLNDIAKAGGYYYYVLPELKIDNEQDSN